MGELEDAIKQLVEAQELSGEVPPKELVKLPKDVRKILTYVLRVQKDAINVLLSALTERLSQDKKVAELTSLISEVTVVSRELLEAVEIVRDGQSKGLEEVTSVQGETLKVLRENNSLLSQRIRLLMGQEDSS